MNYIYSINCINKINIVVIQIVSINGTFGVWVQTRHLLVINIWLCENALAAEAKSVQAPSIGLSYRAL